ncbi:hypothetical protein GCM10009741_60830 [Kribbella lupini]|uniref:Uncharacterized protein n=1 Tax=Kribbella lupini TaxID=291602 RepID=A0ABP4MQJ0_9ACTN
MLMLAFRRRLWGPPGGSCLLTFAVRHRLRASGGSCLQSRAFRRRSSGTRPAKAFGVRSRRWLTGVLVCAG